MEWLAAAEYSLAREVTQRLLGLVYLVAFVSAYNQFPALCGERGLTPIGPFLAGSGFRRSPSLFHLAYSDRLLRGVALLGALVSLGVVVGAVSLLPLAAHMLVWALLWFLYLSIVNVGQTWYSFGWESLLCEAGFLAVFLGNAATAPPLLVLWGFRWLAFRLELGAGLIKLRGDRCWRRLTCLDYHHETQPLPNPLSWYFHRLPRPLHRVEVLANHATQLVIPFGLLAPQPLATVAAAMVIVTQGWLMVSGNYSWLNLLTITVAIPALPDRVWGRLLGAVPSDPGAPPLWFGVAVLAMALVVAVLSYWPLRNLVSRRQLMNYSFNRWHLVNTYGAFGSVTKRRYEIVIEGTDDPQPGPSSEWGEYRFKAKPGDPGRRPPQVAPYHLRLDWLMWFAALSPDYAHPWFPRLLQRLLEAHPATLRLLGPNPFPQGPPTAVRARFYRYRFTTWRERRQTGEWWSRELVGEYAPMVRRAG